MDDSSSWLLILFMILLSALFSGMEIAFITANRLWIALKEQQGFAWAKLLSRYVKKPNHFITTVLIGNNITLVVYGTFMERILNFWLLQFLPDVEPFVSGLIQVVISTLIILSLGEFLPKVIFRQQSDVIIPTLIFPFQIFYYLFWPVTQTIIAGSKLFFRTMKTESGVSDDLLFTKVDLDHYISKSIHSDGNSESELDTEIFKNALDFDKIKVRECMVPRNELVAVELNETIDTLWQTFIESGHSKVLVYKENLDNIIGYVHQVDMFNKPVSIKSVLISILIATESMKANDLLKMFTSNRKSIALVVDEFGGTAGIVTIEDILEEIFGEIEDEHDVEDLTEEVIATDEYKFSARLEVDYLNETYALNIPVGDYETLGGYILSKHESIPAANEKIGIDNYEFHIVSVENARIGDVILRLVNE